MAYIKTKEEIQKIIEGGKILGEILEKLSKTIKPGVSAWEIDLEAERLIDLAGGIPAFKGYHSWKNEPPFPSTICACVNEELVHGIATKDKVLREGDIFTIDIGMQYPAKSKLGRDGNGFFTDTALTLAVGKVPAKTTKSFVSWQAKQKLLNVTKKALEIGIKQCVVGNTVADIGKAIENYVTPQGYGIVRDLVGHGVGHEVHEDPRVPNYYDKKSADWIIQPGVVIAIEPMVTIGSCRVLTADDGWSIKTADGSLCAHFEHTVVVDYDSQIKVATRRPEELK